MHNIPDAAKSPDAAKDPVHLDIAGDIVQKYIHLF